MKTKGSAVITGASSGIGAAFARRFAGQGYDLLLVARREDRLKSLADSLKADYGITAEILVADLGKADDLGVLEQRLEKDPASIVINNAGAGGLGPTSAIGPDVQEAVIQLNILSVVRLSLAALSGFRKAGKGTLINISSILAFGPSAGAATYSGSKSFVLNFTQSLQMEYADSPFRIQVVLPGPIRTEFFTSQGMSDSVFPDSAFITADALVDAVLAGLDAGEQVTIPTLQTPGIMDDMEALRSRFVGEVIQGRIAGRYGLEQM